MTPTDRQLRAFYDSKEWKKLRDKIRERDNHECQWCKLEGKFSPVECIHHIKEVRSHWHLRLDPDNLIGLCNTCHETKAHPEKQKNLRYGKREVPKEWW